MSQPVLQVRDLAVSFGSDDGRIKALDGVNFELHSGDVLGIVGESGCGKSVTALSLMRLLPQPMGRIESGEILFKGQDLAKCPPVDLLKIRGRQIAMIFQEPMTALNPVYTVGHQLHETYKLHFPELSNADIFKRSIDILQEVGIPEPGLRLTEYPHQLSGGMRQRVMIAIALACEPDILVADEPTTALDVTIQAQILELMLALQKKKNMAIIMITHDLGVVAQICQRLMVMYAGRAVEEGPIKDIFKKPSHPYTHGLLSSIPTADLPRKSKLKTISGMVPSLKNMPPGCRFQNRCPLVIEDCKDKVPPKAQINQTHGVWCIRHKDVEELSDASRRA